MSKSSVKTGFIKTSVIVLFAAGAFMFFDRIARASAEPESIDDGNVFLVDQPEEKEKAESAERYADKTTLYERKGKRAIDKLLSFVMLVFLSPVFCLIAIIIEIDDPGPVLFKQKRVGKGGHFFELHKFRSMKMTAPHDIPAEKLYDADQYCTKVGGFLRRSFLDELPQIWDIFRGKMSIVGPRPVLWNTYELIEERDKYGANDVSPGLTGLAQISGPAEMCYKRKAQLDGKYVSMLRKSSISGIITDVRCIVKTVRFLFAAENRGE